MASPLPQLVTSIIGATAYAMVSYGSKQPVPDSEEFKPQKFLRAVLIGVLVGLVAYSAGIQLSPAEFDNIAFSTGIVVIADQLSKFIWRIYKDFDERGTFSPMTFLWTLIVAVFVGVYAGILLWSADMGDTVFATGIVAATDRPAKFVWRVYNQYR